MIAAEQLRFPGLDTGPNINVRNVTLAHMTCKERSADLLAREHIVLNGTPAVSAPVTGIDFSLLQRLLQSPFNHYASASDGHLDLNTGNRRIDYSSDAPAVAHRIACATSYNLPICEGVGNVNLAHPENASLRGDTMLYYQDEPTTVVIPIAKEPVTGPIAINYASETVGGKHVIGITMGIDKQTQTETEEATERNGNTLLLQSEVLGSINWALLCSILNIPFDSRHPNKPPAGSKGLTMLAGALAARIINGHANNGLAVIDSDILNNAHGGYDPLAYLALPGIIDPGNDLMAISISRTGPGRNNEMIINSLNELAHDRERLDADSRLVAYLLAATSSWALTGERLFPRVGDSSKIYQMPWTSGMSIETQMNLYRAALELRQRGIQSAQVFNPNPKVEGGEVGHVREFSMLGRCVDWQVHVLKYCSEIGKQVSEFSIDDIAGFNRRYGGEMNAKYYINETHRPNTPRIVTRDHMLPSVDTLLQMGLVNVDQLQSYAEK